MTSLFRPPSRGRLRKYANPPAVTVGVHEQAGKHANSTETNASIGAKLNYGDHSQGIPPRPWLIPGYEKGEDLYIRDFKNTVEGGGEVKTALERIGVLATGSIQQYMTDLKVPPNAPLTIKLKGSDNPLIDTGELRASVTSKLVMKLPEEGALS